MNLRRLCTTLLFALVPLGFLTVMVVAPLFALAAYDSGGMVREILQDGYMRHRIGWTVFQAAVTCVLTVLAGVPTGWVLARLDFFGRGWILRLLMLPFVMPTLVAGMGVLALFGAHGALWAGWQDTPYLLLYGNVFFNLPVLVRSAYQGFMQVPAGGRRMAAFHRCGMARFTPVACGRGVSGVSILFFRFRTRVAAGRQPLRDGGGGSLPTDRLRTGYGAGVGAGVAGAGGNGRRRIALCPPQPQYGGGENSACAGPAQAAVCRRTAAAGGRIAGAAVLLRTAAGRRGRESLGGGGFLARTGGGGHAGGTVEHVAVFGDGGAAGGRIGHFARLPRAPRAVGARADFPAVYGVARVRRLRRAAALPRLDGLAALADRHLRAACLSVCRQRRIRRVGRTAARLCRCRPKHGRQPFSDGLICYRPAAETRPAPRPDIRRRHLRGRICRHTVPVSPRMANPDNLDLPLSGHGRRRQLRTGDGTDGGADGSGTGDILSAGRRRGEIRPSEATISLFRSATIRR